MILDVVCYLGIIENLYSFLQVSNTIVHAYFLLQKRICLLYFSVESFIPCAFSSVHFGQHDSREIFMVLYNGVNLPLAARLHECEFLPVVRGLLAGGVRIGR